MGELFPASFPGEPPTYPYACQESCPHSATMSILWAPLNSPPQVPPPCIPPPSPIPLWLPQLPLAPKERTSESWGRERQRLGSRGLQVIKARSLVCSGGARGRGTGPGLGSQHGAWGTEGTDVEPGSRWGGQAHLLSPHLDVVVGRGDNDVFR